MDGYAYNGGPARDFTNKREADVKPDLGRIAKEVAADMYGQDAIDILAEYQRRMNTYMSNHGFVFYQP